MKILVFALAAAGLVAPAATIAAPHYGVRVKYTGKAHFRGAIRARHAGRKVH